MGRYRSRSRSYSPAPSRSPPRKRYDDSRGDSYRGSSRPSYRGDHRSSSGPTGLLVRNISLDARVEDLRVPFERFGPVKDVYLPKNYYTGEPRGFGFVKFRNANDAAEAKHQMNHQVIGGREITIVYAEENRKTPQQMRRSGTRVSGRYGGGGRRRSPPRSPRRHNRSYSRSPSPPRRDSRDRDRGARDNDYYSPRRRSITRSPRRRSVSRSPRQSISRSPAPRDGRDYKSDRRSPSPPRVNDDERDYRSDQKSPSPRVNGRSPPPRSRDERDYRSDQRSPSPRVNGRSPVPSRSRSPSHSPR